MWSSHFYDVAWKPELRPRIRALEGDSYSTTEKKEKKRKKKVLLWMALRNMSDKT